MTSYVLQDECLSALMEVNEYMKDYIDISEYQSIFEAENPKVKEQLANNEVVVKNSDSALKKAIEALKRFIRNIIESFKDFFAKMKMDKGERDAFEKFKEACQRDPSLANRKITVKDYRQILAQYDQLIKETEAKIRAVKANEKTPIQELLDKINRTASGAIKSTAGIVTAKVARDMAIDNKNAAQLLLNALQSNEKALNLLEESLGQKGANKYKKFLNSCTKEISLRRGLTKLFHKKSDVLKDTIKTSATNFYKDPFIYKALLSNKYTGGVIKGTLGIVGKGVAKGVKDSTKDFVKSKFDNNSKYASLKDNEPTQKRGETKDAFNARHAKWEKKLNDAKGKVMYGKKQYNHMKKEPNPDDFNSQKDYIQAKKKWDKKQNKLTGANDYSLADYILGK